MDTFLQSSTSTEMEVEVQVCRLGGRVSLGLRCKQQFFEYSAFAPAIYEVSCLETVPLDVLSNTPHYDRS